MFFINGGIIGHAVDATLNVFFKKIILFISQIN